MAHTRQLTYVPDVSAPTRLQELSKLTTVNLKALSSESAFVLLLLFQKRRSKQEEKKKSTKQARSISAAGSSIKKYSVVFLQFILHVRIHHGILHNHILTVVNKSCVNSVYIFACSQTRMVVSVSLQASTTTVVEARFMSFFEQTRNYFSFRSPNSSTNRFFCSSGRTSQRKSKCSFEYAIFIKSFVLLYSFTRYLFSSVISLFVSIINVL